MTTGEELKLHCSSVHPFSPASSFALCACALHDAALISAHVVELGAIFASPAAGAGRQWIHGSALLTGRSTALHAHGTARNLLHYILRLHRLLRVVLRLLLLTHGLHRLRVRVVLRRRSACVGHLWRIDRRIDRPAERLRLSLEWLLLLLLLIDARLRWLHVLRRLSFVGRGNVLRLRVRGRRLLWLLWLLLLLRLLCFSIPHSFLFGHG